MSPDDKRKRLEKRHAAGNDTAKFVEAMEVYILNEFPFEIELNFQTIEKIIDIKEDTVEPQLVQVRVNGEMTREEIVEEILKRVDTAMDEKPKYKIRKLKTDCKYCCM